MKIRICKAKFAAPPTSAVASAAAEADRTHLQFRFLRRRLGGVDPAVLAALAALAFETREAAR